jgi:hypothetical protein
VRLQVEDDETPEMIMAKFAELERIKAAAEAAKSAASACPAGDVVSKPPSAAQEAPAGDLRPQLAQQQGQQQLEHQEGEEQGAGAAGEPTLAAAAAAAAAAIRAAEDEGGLTDEQLLEVFKQTSMFNVRTALQDNEMLLGIDELLEAASERCARGDATPPSTACRTGWQQALSLWHQCGLLRATCLPPSCRHAAQSRACCCVASQPAWPRRVLAMEPALPAWRVALMMPACCVFLCRYAADEPLSDDDDMLRAFWSDEGRRCQSLPAACVTDERLLCIGQGCRC